MNGQNYTKELNELLVPFERALLDCLEACSRKDMVAVRVSVDGIVRRFDPIKKLHCEFDENRLKMYIVRQESGSGNFILALVAEESASEAMRMARNHKLISQCIREDSILSATRLASVNDAGLSPGIYHLEFKSTSGLVY